MTTQRHQDITCPNCSTLVDLSRDQSGEGAPAVYAVTDTGETITCPACHFGYHDGGIDFDNLHKYQSVTAETPADKARAIVADDITNHGCDGSCGYDGDGDGHITDVQPDQVGGFVVNLGCGYAAHVHAEQWGVIDYDDNVLPGTWSTETEATDQGLAGRYLLSGAEVVKIGATGPTRTYVAEFVKAAHADEFAERVTSQNYGCTNVEHRKGRRKVTFDGPDTRQYRMDIAETVGYYGSPPMGPVATLDGVATPRSY